MDTLDSLKKTSLWQHHKDLGAKCTNFAGYDMPLNYGSQIEEHTAVRVDAGVFDVSHMVVIDFIGSEVKEYLQRIVTNDINKAKLNQALYTCMCNDSGGVIDDLIVYCINDNYYRLVTNAATKEKDLAWFRLHANKFDVRIKEYHDLSILSVQGPHSEQKLSHCLPEQYSQVLGLLKNFELFFDQANNWFISRTGYTGEDGFEIILPNNEVATFWDKLLQNKIKPCGLAARDTLRLEAGMALYGQDMDEQTSPFEASLAWTVDLKNSENNFIGKEALISEKQKRSGSNLNTMMIGLVLQDKGVLRSGQKVEIENCGEGVITSGTFSPTMQAGIALARVSVNSNLKNHKQCNVMIRNKACLANIVKYPFVRFNQVVFKEY